jgi:HEPN domain-containing protein
MRQDTMPWWRQAEADLHSAELMLQGGQWYAASWHAQQATEKALKALYIEQNGQMAPYIHDVRRLGALVNAPAVVQQDLVLIYPVFTQTRYPDSYGVPPVDAVSNADAHLHVDAARRALQWVQPQL